MLNVDLFCRVVDNYGDIGVCWRLARQLVAEHGCAVRLIVDDLHAFRVIAPGVDPAADDQSVLGVQVIAWRAADRLVPTDVVIEAFACDPPPNFVEAMAARAPKPVWINLEYLSAETWVDEVHGLPSQHQRLPLTKHFFCPGFTEKSGGLIRESALAAAGPRPPADAGFNAVGLFGQHAAKLSVFAFTYPQAPVRALAQALTRAGLPAHVTVAAPLTDADPAWQPAARVPQTGFDTLLTEFDFLIVRGEDSFVRAQWAAKPLLWHIYPTDDNAHLTKLEAWLERYCSGLEPTVDAAYRAASRAFNRGETLPAPYAALAAVLPQLAAHAGRWRHSLMQQTDLARRLLALIDVVKSRKLG
jgi:hypothetical protein